MIQGIRIEPEIFLGHFPDGAVRFERNLRDFGGFVVSNDRRERGAHRKALLDVRFTFFAIGFQTSDTSPRKRSPRRCSAERSIAKDYTRSTGIMTFNSKFPNAPPKVITVSLPITCAPTG
jgi:hypothetical protein